ncbi:MAG: FAD-binding oxidoreductase, partial [Acidimicrobiales bacterium]
DSATLGGMVATNAGGMHVIRHGTMRARVAGLEAVLANGEIVARMSGLYKDNLGWDLVSLLAGSEGTLAVVTAVALRCVPAPACRVTALVPLGPEVGGSQVGGDIDARSEAFAHAVDIARELRRHVEGLEAVEIVDRAGMVLAASVLGLPAPPRGDRASGWLTVEAAGAVDPSAALSRVLEGATGVLDVAVGTNASSRERLWAYRERQSEAIASLGVPHKIDICLPSGELSRFAERLSPLVAEAAPGARIFCFGHVGDGNLHVNVIGAPCGGTALEDAVLRLAVASGGSISAEHGIGVAKIGYLGLARSPVEVELMRAVKSALDPSGTLNPGVLVP